MARRLLLAALLSTCLGCAREPAEPPVEITRSGGLVVESRPLPADAAFAVVGLRPEAEHDDGSAQWSTSYSESAIPMREGVARRRFRLTIRNRGTSALEFHARIDYFGDEKLVRRRTLDDLLVPPLTERSWIGEVLLPPPADMEPLVRVLPASEPFDGD